MNASRPRIAVTMGDPAGIGPELCLRLFQEPNLAEECVPIVFGDASLLRRVSARVNRPLRVPVRSSLDQADQACVVDLPGLASDLIQPGQVDPRCGEAAFSYILAAIEAARAGQVQAVTTGPINKEALQAAGHLYPGHTELFAERFQAKRWCMMQYSEELTCSFVTVHVGYRAAPSLLTPARILEVIELTAEALRRIRGREPRLLVCGLNPHAGEHGLFGEREEELCIVPAIEAARDRRFQVEGPVPPDTAFTPARRRQFDAVVCMYHDQGHIPIKMIAFDCAVNTTLGLPIVRTSVDHGTAYDIAWKDQASPGSLFAAVRLAVKLASDRGGPKG